MAWDETISAATPLHCLSMGLLSNCQNLQKVGHDIVIFNGNVLGHAWHTWCKKGTNRKRMSCSSPICHMQLFKLFDFRTMGLWIWITFILIRTVDQNYEVILDFGVPPVYLCIWKYKYCSSELNVTGNCSKVLTLAISPECTIWAHLLSDPVTFATLGTYYVPSPKYKSISMQTMTMQGITGIPVDSEWKIFTWNFVLRLKLLWINVIIIPIDLALFLAGLYMLLEKNLTIKNLMAPII